MPVYGYARVSTFEQHVHGFSIDSQCTTILTYVKTHARQLGEATNCSLPGIFIDGGRSAYTKKFAQRPGGLALLGVLKPGDTIIATATHRMFRRMSDMLTMMEHWTDNGITVVFTDYPMLSTDNPNGKAMLRLFGIIAELKSDLTSARIREAKALAKDKPREKPAPVEYTPEPVLTKDIGQIMQALATERDKSKFSFTGKIRAYIRVSTKEQTVEQQRVAINNLLPHDMRHAEIVWYADEGASAFKTKFAKRKAGGKLLSDLEPGDIVVALRPDRLFRSLADMSNVIELIHNKQAYVQTIEGGIKTDTPFGKTLVSLMSLLAEVESQEISRSTKQGMMVAFGVSEKSRRNFLPKFLRGIKRHHAQKHFDFRQLFTAEEIMSMHIQLTLTGKNFRDRRTACRVISNKWLRRKDFPIVHGELGEPVEKYLARVKLAQRQEFTERRAKLIEVLSEYPKGTDVMYPINVTTIAWVDRTQTEWMRVAKTIPGRLRDKQGLTAMAAQCRDPEMAVDLMRRLQ